MAGTALMGNRPLTSPPRGGGQDQDLGPRAKACFVRTLAAEGGGLGPRALGVAATNAATGRRTWRRLRPRRTAWTDWTDLPYYSLLFSCFPFSLCAYLGKNCPICPGQG